jgi:hypothetical protein
MTVLDSYWFNGGGIVKVQNDFGEIEYYIGTWGPLGGMDQAKDAQFIADWGNTFPRNVGQELFGRDFNL